MPSREIIDRFLAQPHVAVVGVSRDPKDFSRSVYRHLREGGRTLYPVNPAAAGQIIEGDTCVASLREITGPVDGVLVMVPAAKADGVVAEAVEAGVRRVWLHRGGGQGAVSPEAVERCRAAGVEVVDGACPFMFDAPVKGVHRFHRFFAKHRFAA